MLSLKWQRARVCEELPGVPHVPEEQLPAGTVPCSACARRGVSSPELLAANELLL